VNTQELAALNAALKTINARLETHGFDREEIAARLAAVEQLVAEGDSRRGSIPPDAVGGAAGHLALAALTDDGYFQAAAAAAGRNQRLPSVDVRANLEMSIRAALTNFPSEGSSSDGSYMPSDPSRSVVGPVLRPLQLFDALPSRPTDRDSVEIVRVEAPAGASEQVLEGDEKAEIEFEPGPPVTVPIVTIAGHTTASKQVLADHRALQQVIDRVMRHKVLARGENQIINGPGGVGRMEGLLELAPTLVPTIGTEPADVVGEALVRLADAGYMPGLILLNVLDWYRIQIMRTDTERAYLFGSPTMPVPPALWRTPIVVTPSMPEGTGLVLDTGFTTVLDRQQVSVTVSTSHKDNFTRNLVTILAEARLGLEVIDAWSMRQFDVLFPS
jgi:HK97 family phage major capsid protein